MKPIAVVIIVILLTPICYSAEWFQLIFTETPINKIYVGVSGGKRNLKDAMNEAYGEAVKEAVKHNFGYHQTLTETFISNLKVSNSEQESFLKTDTIKLKGIEPGRSEVVKNKDDTYTVYREILYPKEEIKKELERLSSLSKKEQIVNTYKISDSAKSSLSIFTTPAPAEIIISNSQNTDRYLGTSNAQFFLPLGTYNLTVSKEGYEPRVDTVYMTGGEQKKQIQMLPVTGTLIIKTIPTDAQVYIDSKAISSGDLKLPIKDIYTIRVEHPDYFSQEKQIKLISKEADIVEISLTAKPSFVSISSLPQGADVYVGGTRIGVTPLLNAQVSEGESILTLMKEGYEKELVKIEMKANRNLDTVNVELRKRPSEEVLQEQADQEELERFQKSWHLLVGAESNLKSPEYSKNSYGFLIGGQRSLLANHFGVQLLASAGLENKGDGFDSRITKVGNPNSTKEEIGRYEYYKIALGLPIYIGSFYLNPAVGVRHDEVEIHVSTFNSQGYSTDNTSISKKKKNRLFYSLSLGYLFPRNNKPSNASLFIEGGVNKYSSTSLFDPVLRLGMRWNFY